MRTPLLSAWLLSLPLSAAPQETVVVAPGPGPLSSSGAGVIDTDDVVNGDTAVLGVPGVALARDGGPLSSSRPLLRGLGGPRLLVDIAGVGFIDPVAGAVDLGLLPLSLGRADVDVGGAGGALGGTLSLRGSPGSRLQLVVGELSTLQLGGRLQVPLEAGNAVAAVDVGTSRGDFPFVTGGVDGGLPLVRTNNDQQRARAVVITDVGGDAPATIEGRLRARVVAAGSVHDGGIPGFATAPLDLRGHSALGSVGAVVEHHHDRRRARLSAAMTGSDRSTSDATGSADSDRITGHAVTVGLGVDDTVVDTADFSVGLGVEVGASRADVDGVARRHQGGAAASGRLQVPLPHAWQVRVDGRCAVQVLGDDDHVGPTTTTTTASTATWLPTGSVRATIGPEHNRLATFVGVSHAARAPTLDERFAPAGFLLAAPDLAAEQVTDGEVGVRLALPDTRMLVAATVFASWLDDAIVVVNDNAFQVRPRNTGPATRAGSELLLVTSPHALLRTETAATLLWSQVQATDAPLPTAPPVSLRTAITVGDDDAFTRATITARGAAPSTIFGTLPSVPYTLVDLMARVPLSAAVGLTVQVNNALDVQTATDVNLLPLPGRLVFVGLEVRS